MNVIETIPTIDLAQAYRSAVIQPRALLLEACRAAGTTVETVRPGSKVLRAVAARQLVCALLMYGVRRVRARRQVVLRVALQQFREMR